MAQPIWNTSKGSLGTFPPLASISPGIQLSASSGIINPTVTYKVISGKLPDGVTMTTSGLISGTPALVSRLTDFVFVVRATNVSNEIADRYFDMSISGYAGPKFDTVSGSLFSTIDSVWVEKYVPYTNIYPNNPVFITVARGILPPGLEINTEGLIRGYPDIPTLNVSYAQVLTVITQTNASTNTLVCASTLDFAPGRPIIFTGTTIGGIEPEKTYYIREIINVTQFTISTTQFGPVLYLTSEIGFMSGTLPDSTVGQPTIKTYSFDLRLESKLGSDIKTYYITVINQNLPISMGGPGNPYFTRLPVILNTKPRHFFIPPTDPYYDYYLFPDDNRNDTYQNDQFAFMGDFQSDNYVSFKVLGYTFDNYYIRYEFAGLPPGLIGDVNTGWIYGTPILNSDTIGQYTFSVRVYKTTNPAIRSGLFNFSMNIYRNITRTVVWITPTDLGTMINTTVSTKYVSATADVPLEYRLVSGTLPPNLNLESNGDITGYVANETTAGILAQDSKTVFDFSIQAYSPTYSLVNSTKDFRLTVLQKYTTPMDTLYMKATPSISDRLLIGSLLTDDTIIPEDYLYRPYDINFGKAKDVIYEHQYGVFASDIEKYLASVYANFYWRNITLGTLATAVARNENNEIIYEVVYSQVIDNLINSDNKSVSYDIVWPKPIPLGLGPWLTTETNIFTSYSNINNQSYNTSLTPGEAIVLYPNSLPNMNRRIAEEIGQEYDTNVLPAWMTSQQLDGNTLGFIRAWVICYTKPGYSDTVKNNIETLWVNKYGEVNKLNSINFTLDRFSVDKSMSYNYDNYFTPPAWTGLPSNKPVPDPKDSQDFYVLFPRKTILPDKTQL